MKWEPLQITVELFGRVVLPRVGYLHLDALLAAAVARIENLPPPVNEAEIIDIEIPVQRSACGQYHLASASVQSVHAKETRWLNKRFPMAEWQMHGTARSKLPRSAGPSKDWRFPVETHHLRHNEMIWWCIGDRCGIELLLPAITAVGRLGGHGEGHVREWRVEGCESWGPGFPVLDTRGRALRHLPMDTAGLSEYLPTVGNVTYPYWRRDTERLIAAPRRS